MAQPETKQDIQAFWKSLYDSLYEDVDSALTRDALFEGLEKLEDMFRYRAHGAVVEMPLDELKGKRVLEIGPGAGGHSALFAKYGAIMTSADLTFHRARATQGKFDLMGDDAAGCNAIQSDAENLPFADNTFDIVYSNGVLHHTLDTEKSMAEVNRILKPGGAAVIMLYAKSSWHYWFDKVLCEGILCGQLLTGRNWLGRSTEWGGKNKQTVANPITRVYTAAGLDRLFEGFEDRHYRKSEFYFRDIPKLGKRIKAWQIKRYGQHDGGYLVYGAPWPVAMPIELTLGKYMGFAWFITAKKPL